MKLDNCRPYLAWIVWLLFTIGSTGCAGPPSSRSSGPYAETRAAHRDTRRAQELTQKAAALVAEDELDEAEALLREALTADLYHGPAHNNLGVIHLKRDALYEAANEFEWARKLMPGHPSPRMNLALTLEYAGRTEEALATYDAALEAYPNHIETLQAKARLQLQHRDIQAKRASAPAQMRDLITVLREIALRGQTERWRSWARMQLALLNSE